MASRPQTLDNLPLFPTEEDLCGALLGPGKFGHWRQIVPLLETDGFPKIDPLMGGRYTPAVRKWFDNEYRLDSTTPVALRDGPEALGTWKKKRGHLG